MIRMAGAMARVLIVDDSRIFRAALAEALAGEEGIVVVGSVFSGEKALEFLRSTPADVATLDVEMPGLDGLQTLAAIQRLNASRPPEAGDRRRHGQRLHAARR